MQTGSFVYTWLFKAIVEHQNLMTCYCFQLVVQVVIAFIVEAFVFRIQVTEKKRHCDKHPYKSYCECMEGNRMHARTPTSKVEKPHT